MQITSDAGVDLALHDLGGDGAPLLIAHATGFCGQAYLPLAEVLAPTFHVWAIDFRGHGDSVHPPDDDFTWEAMGRDALAALDALAEQDGRPVVGVGHSMGGAALLIAARNRPGALSCLYLFEPIVMPEEGIEFAMDNPMATSARRRQATFASRADAMARYASRPPLSRLRADALAAYTTYGFADRADGTVELKCAPDDEAATFASPDKLAVSAIAGLTLPIVVGRGQRQRPNDAGPALLAEVLVDGVGSARLTEYPHLSHLGPLEDPDTVADDIAALAARVSSA